MKKYCELLLILFFQLTSYAQTLLHLNDYPITGPFSVVTPDSAEKIFQQIEKTPILQFAYTRGGCDYRAHAVYILLKQMGINTFKVWHFPSAKIFLGGRTFGTHKLLLQVNDSMKLSTTSAYYTGCGIEIEDYVRWGYHVAPVLLVQRQEGLDTVVVDPALFDHPIRYADWAKYQLQPGGSSYLIFMAGKYVSFESESHFQNGKIDCKKCWGNDIFSGVFFDNSVSDKQKKTEESISRGRICAEYYSAEVQPREIALSKLKPSDPNSHILACKLAKMKQYLSEEKYFTSLPTTYQNRLGKYMAEATATLFPVIVK